MLKIKEDIPLEELEKYGFERKYIVADWCYWKEYREEKYYEETLIVWEGDRRVHIEAIHLLDTLYDLIQAGIVVKE